MNISSFLLKILVKNVLNFTTIFCQKSRWKTWNSFVTFLNLVKNFWKSAEKVLKFKKIMKKFQVFHLVFHWKIAVKFKTFFTSFFTEKLEMFNQWSLLVLLRAKLTYSATSYFKLTLSYLWQAKLVCPSNLVNHLQMLIQLPGSMYIVPL